MNTLDEHLIRCRLPENLRDIKITVLDTVDSTNNYAKAHDITSPQLITANRQTSGRGRLGKSFYSPEGSGIYMTLAIKAPASPEYITIATAVAVARVIKHLGAENIGIKWVNDIFSNGRKVCGILCERTNDKVIIGVGINLTTQEFPEEIADIAGALNIKADRNTVIAKITSEIFNVMALSPLEIIAEYKNYLFILGKKVKYKKNGVVHTAVAEDVNEYGNLIVTSDGKKDILSSGEISLDSSNFV